MSDATATKIRKQGRILVIEDDKNVRSGLALMLQSQGYEVLQAEDARGGTLKAMTMAPDLVVLDIIMPVRSGFELCKKLKSDKRYKDIPVLILSALPQKEQRSEKRWKGEPLADDYLTKPYKATELLEQISRLLTARPGKPSAQ